MVFSREGIIYNKAQPALYSARNVEALNSVTVKRDRVRRNPLVNSRQVSPANSWVCRIASEYHFLPRGKKMADTLIANTFKISNPELFMVGDPLTLGEPHTTLDTSALVNGSVVTLTVEGVTISGTINTALAASKEAQVVSMINNSAKISRLVYAIAGNNAAEVIHLFAKGQKLYTVSGTGVVVGDSALVPMREIGVIAQLGVEASDFNMVTVNPSVDTDAIAIADVPDMAVIDSPIYQEVIGLFNDSIDFENITQYSVAPINGAAGMNVFALSHFDESLKEMFPKITFNDR